MASVNKNLLLLIIFSFTIFVGAQDGTNTEQGLTDEDIHAAVLQWLESYGVSEVPVDLAKLLFPIMVRTMSGDPGEVTDEDVSKIQELYETPENSEVLKDLFRSALEITNTNDSKSNSDPIIDIDTLVKQTVPKIPKPVDLKILRLEELLKFAIYSWSHPQVLQGFEAFTADAKKTLEKMKGEWEEAQNDDPQGDDEEGEEIVINDFEDFKTEL